mmetsp:Transcript_152035/g.264983  ORF Transcript_152035/g.264983 Transcript_152035/m.264983 type:complete len:86 (+) Transcript_152035:1268-1525(+)
MTPPLSRSIMPPNQVRDVSYGVVVWHQSSKRPSLDGPKLTSAGRAGGEKLFGQWLAIDCIICIAFNAVEVSVKLPIAWNMGLRSP